MVYDNVDDLIQDYAQYLEIIYSDHHKEFIQRLENERDAAASEAVVYSYLKAKGFEVKIGEIVGRGGVDFLCTSEQGNLAVEVSHISRDSISRKSTWDDIIPEVPFASSFHPITDKVKSKASKKTSQMSGYEMPRALFITTFHSAGRMLMGKDQAKSLLTGDTVIQVPLGNGSESMKSVAKLKNSTFIRIKDGDISAWRQSISSIILVCISETTFSLVGALHPEPRYNMPISYFPEIPFAVMSPWPVKDSSIEIYWVCFNPKVPESCFLKFDYTDELK